VKLGCCLDSKLLGVVNVQDKTWKGADIIRHLVQLVLVDDAALRQTLWHAEIIALKINFASATV
jgi:hypothetical protein